MINAKAWFIFLVLLISRAPNAHALTPFLEPYVGFGKVQIAMYDKIYNDHDSKDIADGFQLGIKGGLSLTNRIFVAADYNTGGPYVFGRAMGNAEWNMRLLGGGAGINYEAIRFWAGYYPSQVFDDTKNSKKYKGDAYKVGFGLVIVKNLHANLDIIFHNLTSVDQGGSNSPLNDAYRVQSANVSISIPIEIK